MTQIFLSYKREDGDRAAVIVDALRGAGLTVWWDQDIPAGAQWRQVVVSHLDAAELCLVLWTPLSTAQGGRYVIEEAERAAGRDAYLGVRLDSVIPPFGFTEQQAIDLSAWSGRADDPRLAAFVAQVQARLDGRMPVLPSPKDRPLSPPARRSPVIALPAALLLILAAAGAWWFWPRAEQSAEAPSLTRFVNASLATYPCTWVQISNVASGGDGERVRLSGLAPAPGAIPSTLMNDPRAAGLSLRGVDVTDVATAPPTICNQVNSIRQWRDDDAHRLTIIPHPGPLTQTEHGFRGELEFEVDMAGLRPHAALLGLDSRDGLYVLAPDLVAYRNANPPTRTSGSRIAYRSFFFTENADVQNVGLLLLLSDRPIDQALVESIGRSDDPAATARVRDAAAAGNWQVELGLVRCGFGTAEERRC